MSEITVNLNMKISLLCICAVLCFGCASSSKESEQIKSSSRIDSVSRADKEPAMNNPALMHGSSFGNYFQSLYKLGRFDDMLKFTSDDSKRKFGNEKIRQAYEEMDFGYVIKLKSIVPQLDSTIILNYLSTQFPANKIIRMDVRIEHDSVKLVVNKLDKIFRAD